jgi:hypothetical protein
MAIGVPGEERIIAVGFDLKNSDSGNELFRVSQCPCFGLQFSDPCVSCLGGPELPVFVSIGAEPVSGIMTPLIGEPHRDPVMSECARKCMNISDLWRAVGCRKDRVEN